MTKIVIEDFLKKTRINKFDVLMVAAYRACEIYSGKNSTLNNERYKAPIMALKEISEKIIDYGQLKEKLTQKLAGDHSGSLI